MILPNTCVFGSRSCSAEIRHIFLPWCLPPCVLVSLDSRLEMVVDDDLNSTVAKFASIFLVLWPLSFFFGQKIPYVAIFYYLSWLVGWLVVIWYYFRDVCHPKKITVPLVLLTSPPVFLPLLPSGARALFPRARVRLNRPFLHPFLVRHPRPLGCIPFPFLPSPLPSFLHFLLIRLLSSRLFLFLPPPSHPYLRFLRHFTLFFFTFIKSHNVLCHIFS